MTRNSLRKTLILAAIFLGLAGCVIDPLHPLLRLRNQGDRQIETFVNVQYPDSSLKSSMGDSDIPPGKEDWVGSFYRLDRYPGITVFVFDYGYVRSRWHEGVGTPDTYLEQEKILKRYHLSKAELDSLGWSLVYP